jgi:hypothetical protein
MMLTAHLTILVDFLASIEYLDFSITFLPTLPVSPLKHAFRPIHSMQTSVPGKRQRTASHKD